ncbi:MAG: Gfo/Idh/MocA family protein, partial [Planctomycetota bacterium]
MSLVRLGVIGCGGMSGSHLRHYGDLLGSRMTIAATADIDPTKARKAAEVTGAERAVTDYREMLDRVDAVLISLPHNLHHAVGMECIQAGKHVLMEKPLAVSEAECLDLIHAAADGGRVLMTAYCMRYHPLIVKFKELLDAKAYGEVFQVSIWTEQHTERPGWYRTREGLGGGQFFSHGCHYVDLLLWFLGRPVRGHHLGTNFGTPWMEAEGTSNVAMAFEGGPLAYHFGTWGAKGSRLKYSFHAHCTGGMLEVRFKEGKLLAHRDSTEELLLQA